MATTPNNRDGELWFSNPAEAEAQLEARMAQQVAGALQHITAPLTAAAAETAKSLSRSDNKEVWEKYGPEIEALTQNVRPDLKGNRLLWDQAAKLVKSNHIDEIAAERAQELAAAAGSLGVESGTGGSLGVGSGGGSSNLDALRETPYGAQLIERFGERGVLKNIEAMGETVEGFTKMAEKTTIVRDPENPGQWRNTTIGQKS